MSRQTQINKMIGYWYNEAETEGLRKRGVKVGKDCHIAKACRIDQNHPGNLEIGDNVVITEGCAVMVHDASTKIRGLPVKVAPTKIGNNVFIGLHSIVLCGTTIGDNVIVGAGSVVTKDIPSNETWAGNPAKKIK